VQCSCAGGLLSLRRFGTEKPYLSAPVCSVEAADVKPLSSPEALTNYTAVVEHLVGHSLRVGAILQFQPGKGMPYKLQQAEADVLGEKQFINAKGDTECVEFVRQATGAPQTTFWKPGVHVVNAKVGTIPRGTAIATFDKDGKYPTDALGKHAAIYLSHDVEGIRVLDQWNKQGKVLPRTIHINRPDFPRINSAKQYFVIE
jgi:hypothetical protein